MLGLTIDYPAGIGGELTRSALHDSPGLVALDFSVPVAIVPSIPAGRGRRGIADLSSLIAAIRAADRMGATS